MKRLWILRHAKSSWSDAGLDDHDRPLNRRGERAAVLIGATLAQREAAFDLILASTALRVRQTVERVRDQLSTRGPTCFEPALYLATASDWIDRLRQLEDADDLLAVGHNPTLEELVAQLAPVGDKSARRRLREGLPTAALAEIELDLSRWGDLRPGSGRLASFSRPKDLV